MLRPSQTGLPYKAGELIHRVNNAELISGSASLRGDSETAFVLFFSYRINKGNFFYEIILWEMLFSVDSIMHCAKH